MSFSGENAKSSKALDYALVIAGWKIIYSITRSIPNVSGMPTTGDLRQNQGFVAVRPWANLPVAVGESPKNRPEEGVMTLAQVDVPVLDRFADGRREISDLLAREAYLDGNCLGVTATLSTSISSASTTELDIMENVDTAASVASLPDAGEVYVGLECIHYSAKTNLGSGSWKLTGLTRGYRLTSFNPHRSGASVFSFLPTIYRQRAFIYKGYENLPLENWQRAFGGVIVGASKVGAKSKLSLMSTTWLTWTDGREVLVTGAARADIPSAPKTQRLSRMGSLVKDVLAGDFSGITIRVDDEANLANGHYIANANGHWMALKSME